MKTQSLQYSQFQVSKKFQVKRSKMKHKIPRLFFLAFFIFQTTNCCMKRSANDCNRGDSKDKNLIRVVIVGAGASGLAAASKLSQYPDKIEVTVLEALDRVGGRIKNGEIDGQVVPMGAQWIHGEEGNVAYEMAQELDIIDTGPDLAEMPNIVVNEYGEVWNETIYEPIMTMFYKIMENPKEYNKHIGARSLGEFFSKALDYESQNETEAFKDKVQVVKDLGNRHFQGLDACDNWMTEAYKGSMELFVNCPGNENVSFKDGHSFMDIINLLLSKIQKESVQLQKKATKIVWSDKNVKVEVNNGEEFIDADYVVFTASIGYLKENHHNIFEPGLPDDKAKAIEVTGFGSVAKIYLLYDSEWWPSDIAYMDFAFPDSTDFEYDENEAQVDWTRWVLSVYRIAHKKKILGVWISGAGAREMERDSDEETLEKVKVLMRKFIGKAYPNMQDPIGILRTKWHNDRLFRGTYSYMTLEGLDTDVVPGALSAYDTTSRLRFAGEATHPHYFSTVHGAIESGWREADKIIAEEGVLY